MTVGRSGDVCQKDQIMCTSKMVASFIESLRMKTDVQFVGGGRHKGQLACCKLWTFLLFTMLTLDSIQPGLGGNLNKQFVPTSQETARSMESYKDTGTAHSDTGHFDVGSILCEKYHDWTAWSTCSRKCEQTRMRKCRKQDECGRSVIKEKRTCKRPKGSCSPLTYKVIGAQSRNRLIEELLYDLLYHKWSEWGPCTRSCRHRRQRKCKLLKVCEHSYIQEERRCTYPGSLCEHRYSLKAVGKGDGSSEDDDNGLSEDDDEDDNNDDEDIHQNEKGEEEEETSASDSQNDRTTLDTGGGTKGNSVNPLSGSHVSRVGSPSTDMDRLLTGGQVITGVSGSASVNSLTTDLDHTIPIAPTRKRWRNRKKRRRLHNGKLPAALGREFLQAQKSCGYRPHQSAKSYRVVGGREVRRNSWPWQVAILTRFKEQYCGGTLIAPRWVLTAAHCVRKDGKRRRLIVRVGEHDIAGYDPTEDDIRPEKEFPHPDFDYNTITNDIALIKLRTPPPSFAHPGYACLPVENFTPSRDRLCNIVGWGKLKNTHLYGSETLQEARVPVVRHRRCQKVFTYPITKQQVCAGYKRGGIDSCAGDSGGPLLCPVRKGNGTDRYVLHGVTSYGEGCGQKGKYGIYTKVSSYLNWIYKTISDNR